MAATLKPFKLPPIQQTELNASAATNPPTSSSLTLEQQATSLLHKCNSTASLTQLHAHLIKTNLLLSDPVMSAFFFVSSCAASSVRRNRESIEYARSVFDRIPTPSLFLCNNMIRAYTSTSTAHSDEALQIYSELMDRDTIHPNRFTYPPLLKACAAASAADYGRALHGQVVVRGLCSDPHINASLIHMYAKCCQLTLSLHLFEETPDRDPVTWTTVIAACSRDKPVESFRLFRAMQFAGFDPNEVAIVGALTACANAGALEIGVWLHAYAVRRGIEMNVKVVTALIDMYAKSGSIDLAKQVFDRTELKNKHSWTVMIVGLAMHGLGRDALDVFDRMNEERVKPDALTFVGVLCACSHTGMVDEGRECFNSMVKEHNVVPSWEHYGCMVDLLGRQGLLDEAYDLIRGMPIEPNTVIWRSLLGSCRVHCNVELGERAAEVLFELEPGYNANYLLLANLYALQGRWDDVAKVRSMMKERCIKKTPGSSSIEVNGEIHEFVVADRAHPRCDEIHRALRLMVDRLKEAGYVPQTSEALLNVSEMEKEEALLWHSEKLAAAYGLISTSQGSTIRVINNTRMCGDCHVMIKLASKVFEREIIVRDCLRFHHFVNGICSCKDFW